MNFIKNGLCDVSWVTITNRFKKYIPKYVELSSQGKTFYSDENLIGIYE